MRKRLRALQENLKDSPGEKKIKEFMSRNGFTCYMTDRWQLDFSGRATIFMLKAENKVTFSANFILGQETGVKRAGFIACAEIDIEDAPAGLDKIVTILEKKYEKQ